MRKKQTFIIITTLLTFCLAMTACAERTRIGQDDLINGTEDQNSATILDPDSHDPFDDIDDQGQPREKATEGETNDGLYAYEVGDMTVYTEHDLNRWLMESEKYPGHYNFDIGALLIDFWCQDNHGGIFENDVGFSYILDGDNTKGIWFDAPDVDNDRMFHAVTIWYKVDETERTTTIRIYDCPPAPENKEKYYSIMDHYTHIIHKDMAPLILYTIEQMEANPRSGALNDLELGDNFYCD